jgi:16S rRNA (guanine527-N7)-methyltransferase
MSHSTSTATAALPPPARARLAELARRYGLDNGQEAELAALLAVIATDGLAPTTVRDPALAVDRHVADSLVGLEVEAITGARTAADLGAGAGLPGLVLAAAVPACRWYLVESVSRKVAFMDRAEAAMGLPNVVTVNRRAEEWREGLRANDVITARAVAPAPVVLEYAAPLLCVGGSLVDWRTRLAPSEDAAALAAAHALGLDLAEARAVTPFIGAHSRWLYVYLKVRDTPDRFPRRSGTARKRPLGPSTRG